MQIVKPIWPELAGDSSVNAVPAPESAVHQRDARPGADGGRNRVDTGTAGRASAMSHLRCGTTTCRDDGTGLRLAMKRGRGRETSATTGKARQASISGG